MFEPLANKTIQRNETRNVETKRYSDIENETNNSNELKVMGHEMRVQINVCIWVCVRARVCARACVFKVWLAFYLHIVFIRCQIRKAIRTRTDFLAIRYMVLMILILILWILAGARELVHFGKITLVWYLWRCWYAYGDVCVQSK